MFLIPATIGTFLVIGAIVLERRKDTPDKLDHWLWKGALFILLLALLIAAVQGFRA